MDTDGASWKEAEQARCLERHEERKVLKVHNKSATQGGTVILVGERGG